MRVTAIWGQNGVQGSAGRKLTGDFQHRGSQRQGKSRQGDVVLPGTCSGWMVGHFSGKYLRELLPLDQLQDERRDWGRSEEEFHFGFGC